MLSDAARKLGDKLAKPHAQPDVPADDWCFESGITFREEMVMRNVAAMATQIHDEVCCRKLLKACQGSGLAPDAHLASMAADLADATLEELANRRKPRQVSEA